MDLIITLFWIGFLIVVGSAVFSIVISLFFTLIGLVFAFIGWVIEKMKGN